MRKITVYDGKYTLCIPDQEGERFHALRYGEEWRDLIGDGMVLALCHEIEELREQLSELRMDLPR